MVAVGPRLYERYLTELHPYGRPDPIKLDPGFDGSTDDSRAPPPGAPWKILVLGRLEDSGLKGIDLAAKAVGLTMGRRESTEPSLELVARGARLGTSEDLQEKLKTLSGNPALNVVVRPFTMNTESIDADIRRASLVLMPSRKEGFGLVGLEAIVAGTPLLASNESGLGELLRTNLSPEQSTRIVVRTTGDLAKDQEAWARAVEGVLRDREAAFRRASEVRALLAAKKTWAGAVTHLLSALGSIAPCADNQSISSDSKNEVVASETPQKSNSAREYAASTPAIAPTPSELIANPDATIRCIDNYEPSPEIFGRNNEVEIIVSALAHGAPVIVAGGPGMGKTSIVTAALYDPRIIERFGRRRVFASLEAATEPRAIVSKLVETLGISPTGDEATLLRIVVTSAAERPIAAVLDNVETVFDSDRAEAERLLNLIARIKGLSVAITIRGVPPSVAGANLIDDLPKLDSTAAHDAFLSIAGASFATDPDLPALLNAFDGHALSICLVAARSNGLPSLQGIRESWDEARAEILRRPSEEESRLNSVRASLALSLSSRRMKSNPFARRLLALLGYLPAGLPVRAVIHLLGDRGMVSKAVANEAVGCLHQLRLVERRLDGRLRMLTPLRESVKQDVPLQPTDKKRLINYYLEIAAKARTVGSARWESTRAEVEDEADNLDPICEMAITAGVAPTRLDQALAGLADFHSFSGRASVSSLGIVITSHQGRLPPETIAKCTQSLAEIANARSDHETARAGYEQALKLFRRLGNVSSQANCILGLGEIANAESDHELAQSRHEEALILFQRIGNVTGEANCVLGLGTIAEGRSDRESAGARFKQAQVLYRHTGGAIGEANCILCLGQIAAAHSDHGTAQTQFQEALTLFRRVGGVMGEANCIMSLGEIASARRDHEAAWVRFQESLKLYRRIGSVLGEANCILCLGEIAYAKSDYQTAEIQYEEALTLFRRIDGATGEAGCIMSLGEIANAQSDPRTALARYEESLALYRRIGTVAGQVKLLMRSGQMKQKLGDASSGLEELKNGFTLYFDNVSTEDRALAGWRALERALTSDNPFEASKGREEANVAWSTVGRYDLIHDWIERN